ncbi:MAG TPA: thioredoxin domain-containing protein, partial [Pyrinomonadaceae bacterium]|nr:thioredoxin domain-containing protein [Pyrinomonadaceae bacterium]
AKQRVDADLQRGRSMNINQTPTLYVNGKSIPYEQMTVQNLKQVIDAELQKAPNSGQDSPASQPAANTATENK